MMTTRNVVGRTTARHSLTNMATAISSACDLMSPAQVDGVEKVVPLLEKPCFAISAAESNFKNMMIDKNHSFHYRDL